jgi:hypothetical protein
MQIQTTNDIYAFFYVPTQKHQHHHFKLKKKKKLDETPCDLCDLHMKHKNQSLIA